MNKTISTNKQPVRKVIQKIFFLLLATIGVLIIGYLASIPLFDRLDQDRFITLDTQIQTMFQNIKAASNGTDPWKYSMSCEAELTGDWPTGSYYCTSLIIMDKTATSVDTINELQAKYYPLINNTDFLKPITELDPQFPNDFGKKFVISSASKNYIEIKSGVECGYMIKLYQSVEDTNRVSNSYGSEINNGIGNIRTSLSCTRIARRDWYPLTK